MVSHFDDQREIISKTTLDVWGQSPTLLASFSLFPCLVQHAQVDRCHDWHSPCLLVLLGRGKGLLVLYHPPSDPTGMQRHIPVLVSYLTDQDTEAQRVYYLPKAHTEAGIQLTA